MNAAEHMQTAIELLRRCEAGDLEYLPEAAKHLLEAQKLDPNAVYDGKTINGLISVSLSFEAKLFVQKGDDASLNKALLVIDKALKYYEFPGHHSMKAAIYVALKNLPMAQIEARDALRLNPDDEAAKKVLAEYPEPRESGPLITGPRLQILAVPIAIFGWYMLFHITGLGILLIIAAGATAFAGWEMNYRKRKRFSR